MTAREVCKIANQRWVIDKEIPNIIMEDIVASAGHGRYRIIYYKRYDLHKWDLTRKYFNNFLKLGYEICIGENMAQISWEDASDE